MNCPTCEGNGELEQQLPREEKDRAQEERIPQFYNWVPICPTCNGTGYIEQI